MHQHGGHGPDDTNGAFPTEVEGLPEAGRSLMSELADGEMLDLRIAPAVKRLSDATVRMLAFNGSIPGPTVRVQQGSEIVVRVTNDGAEPTTPGSTSLALWRTDRSATAAASPTSPACISSASPGSTPAARRCSASSRTTPPVSPAG